MQAALESDSLGEQQLFDYRHELRPLRLLDDQGHADPVAVRRQAAADHGRQTSIRARLFAWQLSPRDVNGGDSGAQNIILPTGTDEEWGRNE